MKTFQQFNEDIDRLTQRRQQLRQRQLKQMAAHKEKVAAHREAQSRRRQKQAEREQLKQELRRELQTEQTPVMQPNLYNQLVARRQATQKGQQIRHVHGELGAEARAQQSAKRQRLNKLTRTP
jgi:hypothetical protein